MLVGNFGDGTINAFDLKNGNVFVGQMKDSNGAVITNLSLWDMVFGGGGLSGDTNTMYITAGLSNEMHGLFAGITANAAPPPPAADFTISGPATPVTINAGQTGMFTVTLGGLNGFNSAVNLTCSNQPRGSACTLTPASVSPSSGGTITSTVSIATSSNPYAPAGVMGMGMGHGMFAMLLLIPALGLFGLLVGRSIRKQRLPGSKWTLSLASSFGLLIVAASLLTASGCGYNRSNSGNGTQRGTTTVMITGTSGNLSHSTSVTLTVQ